MNPDRRRNAFHFILLSAWINDLARLLSGNADAMAEWALFAVLSAFFIRERASIFEMMVRAMKDEGEFSSGETPEKIFKNQGNV